MTKSQLIKRVLQKLRALEVGESPDSDQTATVGAIYDEVYQGLKTDGVVTWTATGEIPDLQATPVIIIIAAKSVDEFFIPEGRASRLIIQEQTARQRLYELNSEPYVSTSEPVSY